MKESHIINPRWYLGLYSNTNVKIFTRRYFQNCIFVGVSEKMALTTSQLLKVRVSRAKTCLDLWNRGEPCVSQTPKVIRLIWPITCYNSSPWTEFGFGNFRAACPSVLLTYILDSSPSNLCLRSTLSMYKRNLWSLKSFLKLNLVMRKSSEIAKPKLSSGWGIVASNWPNEAKNFCV